MGAAPVNMAPTQLLEAKSGTIEGVALESKQESGGLPKEVHRQVIKQYANATSDVRGLMQLSFHLGCALCSGWIINQGLKHNLLLLVVGELMLSLTASFYFNAFHECIHNTAFSSRWLNSSVAHLLGFLTLRGKAWYLLFHWAHHRFTNDPTKDPELSGCTTDSTSAAWLCSPYSPQTVRQLHGSARLTHHRQYVNCMALLASLDHEEVRIQMFQCLLFLSCAAGADFANAESGFGVSEMWQYAQFVSGYPFGFERIPGIVSYALGGHPKDDFWVITDKHRSSIQIEYLIWISLTAGVALHGSALAAPLIYYWLLPHCIGSAHLRYYQAAEHRACQQGPYTDTTAFVSSRTTTTWWLYAQLAWNMPFHAEHHAWPNVPFHHLPAVHDKIAPHRPKSGCNPTGDHGYSGLHYRLLRQTLAAADVNQKAA